MARTCSVSLSYSVAFSCSLPPHLYRVGEPGPASFSLGDTSQASPLNSEFKNPLSTCQSHAGVQQEAQPSWPQMTEISPQKPALTLSPSPNIHPSSVKDGTSHPPRCSGEKCRNHPRLPGPKSLHLNPKTLSALSPNVAQPLHSSLLAVPRPNDHLLLPLCKTASEQVSLLCSVQAFSPHKAILSKCKSGHITLLLNTHHGFP